MSHDFIKQVLDCTEAAESPRSFFYWSALAAISAVVRNNVYLSKGGLYGLKPNIYVILKGPSGVRKSFPVSLAKKLVIGVGNTRVISGINSIEKILQVLGTAKTLENGTMITEGTALLTNDELSTMILDNPMSQTYLTTLHDSIYHEDFTYDTKSGGEIRIKKPYVTILGASNDEHFQDFLHKKSMRGGFIARTFIQDERVPARINPLVDEEPELPIKSLVDTLKEISKITGKFEWSKNGGDLFKEWYNDIRTGMIENPDKDPTGTMNRIHDQGLKVAMLLSLARGHELIIQIDDMQDAIETCTTFMTLAKTISAGSGESELSLKMNFFISDLLKAENFRLPHKKIVQKRFGDMSMEDIMKMVEMLNVGGMLEIDRTGGILAYKLTDLGIKEFGGLLGGGKK